MASSDSLSSADDGCKAARQCLDEIAASRKIRSFDDLAIRCVGSAVPDVLHGGSMKQRKVLGHDRNGCPQAFLRDPCDVLPIDRDAAVMKIIEALDQREQARLASSRRTDEADALARLKRQAQAFENGMSIRITK